MVTDGFTGNVALKISESLAETLGAMIREELTRDWMSKVAGFLARPAFRRFRKRVDYVELGGAPLLGIDGASIICHGASPPAPRKTNPETTSAADSESVEGFGSRFLVNCPGLSQLTRTTLQPAASKSLGAIE